MEISWLRLWVPNVWQVYCKRSVREEAVLSSAQMSL
jgi:hypothetical protein